MMREKRRSPHFVLATIATMLAITAMLVAGFYHWSGPTTLKVAVGPPKGDNARLMTAIAVRLSRDRAPIRLRIVEKEGPLQAAAALDKGEVDLAIARRDVDMPQFGQAVVVFRKNVVGVFATAQSKVKTISDLTGKKVGLVGRNSANEKLLESILLQYRVDPKTVTVVPLDSDDIPGSIKTSKTDIVVASGPVIDRVLPSVFQSLSQNGRSPSIIPIKEADAIAQRNPVYESAEIIAGSFGGNPPKPADKVETIGYIHYMMAHRSLNESTVGEVTRLMLSVRDALTPQFPRAAMIKAPDTDKDAAVPAHPGAAAYVDGEQKSVFDKYGDLLYLGAMLASLFGSAGAGLAAFLKKGRAPERAVSENPLPLDRLIEIIAAARIASDQSELDLLQAEADEILALSLKQHISGVADPVGFSGLAFALDQVRHTVSDRRAALLTQFTGPSAATNRPLRSV